MALRLNLGSGNNKIGGFINIDKYDKEADVLADICELPYPNDSVDEIVSYQVIEHLPYWQTGNLTNSIAQDYPPKFFQECFRVLKPGGFMITECPDIELIAQKIVKTGDVDYVSMINLYGEYYRPWDTSRYDDWDHQAGSLHINAFTWKRIQKIAERVGFEVYRQTMDEKHVHYRFEENLSVKWVKPL